MGGGSEEIPLDRKDTLVLQADITERAWGQVWSDKNELSISHTAKDSSTQRERANTPILLEPTHDSHSSCTLAVTIFPLALFLMWIHLLQFLCSGCSPAANKGTRVSIS